MLFSLFTPVLANSQSIGKNTKSNGKLHQSLFDSKSSAKTKVSQRLLSEFKNNDKVTFLVKFNEKAETTLVANKARNSEQSKNSPIQAEFLQRSAVVSELKSISLKSQQRVIEFLERETRKGNVEDFRSYFIVNGIAVTATKEIAEQLAAFSEVEKVLPNETRKLLNTKVENEKIPHSKLENVEWNVERVNAPQAWAMGIDGSGTVVASIDTGVQWDHPALKVKYRGFNETTGEVNHSYSFYDATAARQKAPYDDHGHGTHVTGTMIGSEPDGSNQIGVAPGAKWIAAKAFDSHGNATDAVLLDAAEWIIAPGGRIDLAPDAVNNSWSGGPGLNEWYRDTIRAWRDAGIFPEFAAGNTDLLNPGGPGSIPVPANYPESFAVGATDSNDGLAGFSLRGPSPYDEIKPDITAPGVNIRSAVPGNSYDNNSGTSMASPVVTAVAAMLRQANASLTVDEMEEILLNTATPLTDIQYPVSPNNGYGYGLVNARNALSFIISGPGKIKGQVLNERKKIKTGLNNATMNNQIDFYEKGLPNSDLFPSEARVSVLESGYSVKTNPSDGTYSLLHAAGTFTVKAEAYGFYPAEQTITVVNNETSIADFYLKKMAQANITGIIKDQVTGKRIPGVTVLLLEDANVTPVETDENGYFTLTLYKGNYTLRVMAQGYHWKEIKITVGDSDQELNVDLEPFYTYPGGEIGYDDGSAENALAFLNAGNAYAVKMSLPKGKNSALVTDGIFCFWEADFPDPGGTEFAVEVWDSSGAKGFPGKKIAGPFYADAIRDKNQWTIVDLRKYNIIVEDDFYMVYRQTGNNPYVPGLASDEDGIFANRSYQYNKSDGLWIQTSDYWGNFMIRARVSYEVVTPVITSPVNDFITNEAEIIVEGTASPSTTIQLLNNGENVGTAKVGDDGTFAIPTKLIEGENNFKALSLVEDKLTKESETVTVKLVLMAPELTIDNPKHGDKTNRETVTVEGTVSAANLDWVKVNGQKTDVVNGKYSKRVMLDNGENEIKVVAQNIAGNKTTKKVKVFAKYFAPQIDHLLPNEDKTLDTGQSVKIEFDSEPGLRATFYIHMPLTNTNSKQITNATELPMMEMANGHYVGYWTVPLKTQANGAAIEVKAVDTYGNEIRKIADGKLFINVGTTSGGIGLTK
ncbi:S8 family serine peptidase [Heyndrickxia sp. NPDC080065]|uniref:S8 family serine peptidase n=1 Tax=Heyndrickxia sp. NPDC080065 TaxID=3390568 RepID=UPI003D084EF2